MYIRVLSKNRLVLGTTVATQFNRPAESKIKEKAYSKLFLLVRKGIKAFGQLVRAFAGCAHII